MILHLLRLLLLAGGGAGTPNRVSITLSTRTPTVTVEDA